MGHSLHIIVVNAKTGKEALREAESAVDGWGNDNNWRSFIMAIPAKGRRVLGDEGDGYKDFNTLRKINAAIDNESIDESQREAFERLKTNTSNGGVDWCLAGQYCEAMYEMINKPKPFDVLKDSYKEGQYDEFGVTQCRDDEPQDGEQVWAVLMDMHS